MIQTLKVRPYGEPDKSALDSLFYAHGFDYDMPNVRGQDILSSLVLEEDGVRAAALLRLEVNAFLLLDHEWATPQERWEGLQMLHEAMRQKAEDAGIEEANCWLPPEIEKPFAQRLESLQWKRNLWNSYSRKVKGY